LHLSIRQFQRLKRPVRDGGALTLRHQGRGRPSGRRRPAAVSLQVQALLQDRYAGFNCAKLLDGRIVVCAPGRAPIAPHRTRSVRALDRLLASARPGGRPRG
jgi:hypothetical protein